MQKLDPLLPQLKYTDTPDMNTVTLIRILSSTFHFVRYTFYLCYIECLIYVSLLGNFPSCVSSIFILTLCVISFHHMFIVASGCHISFPLFFGGIYIQKIITYYLLFPWHLIYHFVNISEWQCSEIMWEKQTLVKILHLKNSNLYSLQIFVSMKILISASIFYTAREK